MTTRTEGEPGQQRLAVHQDHRVAVGVDHPGGGTDLARDLMDVTLTGQPGADIEELADPGLACQVPDHPAQERPVGLGAGGRVGHYPQRELHDGPVRGEVVLAAQVLITYWAGNHTSGIRPELTHRQPR